MQELHISCKNENKDDIETFLQDIKIKYEKVIYIILKYQYYEQLKKYRNSSKMLETPEYVNEIMMEIENLKTYFIRRIDSAKANIQ